MKSERNKVKMKKGWVFMIILLLICILYSNNCLSCTAKDNTNIEIDISPSGGGEEGYSIIVVNDTLTVQVRSLVAVNETIVLSGIKEAVTLKLSDTQQDSLCFYLKEFEQYNQSNKDNAFILDTWIYVVKINDLEIAKFNSITLLEKSNDERINALKALILYTINLSPLKLDLQSFS